MSKYETPTYEVQIKKGDFEIRLYESFSIIEYNNKMDPTISSGFGTLFNYISRGNQRNEKISMTVPVIEEVSGDKKKMAFVVPSKFGENIPLPNNQHLEVAKFNGGLYATIRYGGTSNEVKEKLMKKRLEGFMIENDYMQKSNYMLAFYNAPFIPPMFRRNELLVRVVKTING